MNMAHHDPVAAASAGDALAHKSGAPHVLAVSVLLRTAAALLALTVLTVASSRVDLGELNVVVALAIACCKAAVVALFFMHLKYEKSLPAVVLAASLFFALLLVGFVMFDTTQYQPSIAQHAAVKPKGP